MTSVFGIGSAQEQGSWTASARKNIKLHNLDCFPTRDVDLLNLNNLASKVTQIGNFDFDVYAVLHVGSDEITPFCPAKIHLLFHLRLQRSQFVLCARDIQRFLGQSLGVI